MVPGASLHVAVTGAALQFQGVGGQTVGLGAGAVGPRALGVRSLICREPMKQYHSTPGPLGLGEAVDMESRKLEDWEEVGRKEDRQGKALLSISQTDKHAHAHTRRHAHTHTCARRHACTHTLLVVRIPSDTLFHRAPESTESHEPGLKSQASSSPFLRLPFLIYKRRSRLHISQGCHEEQIIFQALCSLPSYPGQAPATLHPDTAAIS